VTYVLIGLGAVVGLGVGLILGLRVGTGLSARPKTFWMVIAALFAASIVVTGLALQAQMVWLAGMALGTLTGGLTGLKYGRDAELRSLVTRRGR
jgi:hypothetical protein